MEILTASGRVDSNLYSDGHSVVDIQQVIANSGANKPAIDGPSANPQAGEKTADWDKLAADGDASAPSGQDSPHEGRIGRKKKPLGLEGDAGQAFAGVMLKEDAAALREGKPASRQSFSLRGAGQDIPGALTEAEGRRRVNAAALRAAPLSPVDNVADLKINAMTEPAALGAGEVTGEGDQNPFSGLVPAGVPVNSRPAGELLPAQLKAPDPLLSQRQLATTQFAPEMKNHRGDRGGTLLYTFNKGNAVSSDAMTVNQVQISFQGSPVLTPSNRTTQENLLANQSEAQGYVVKSASDREQQQRQRHDRDDEPGEDQ